MNRRLVIASLVVSSVHAAAPRVHAAPCDGLLALKLPNTTVSRVETVAAGAFVPPENATAQAKRASYAGLPAFCRALLTLTPSADSDIRSEVWLPANWNGRLQVVGNGGWAGSIGYTALADAVRDGYAAAATDTGHEGGRATFALGHPEKLVDNAWRAVHETTVQAKAVLAAYYGDGPKYSYWIGCSSGGKQGLKEAQRFPADFDGIVAGAPANNMIRLHAGSLWNYFATHETPGSYIPPAKYPVIHKAVVAACDALDGATDGLIEDPARCTFDPASIACRDADGPECLTTPQVAAARKIYGGAVNPRTKARIFPGWERGSELGWGITAGPEPEQTPLDTFGIVVYQDPRWDWHAMDFDAVVAKADAVDGGTITSTDPDLSAFFARGGKLLLYHGWNDPNIAPRNTIDYYQSVVSKLGGVSKVDASMRLFMVPGMAHCGGGEGPNVIDRAGTIRAWVEEGRTPSPIVARRETDGKVERTRPLCRYPQVARYTGSGSLDDAANFVCGAPAR